MAESEKATEYKLLKQKSEKIISESKEFMEDMKTKVDQKFFALEQPTNVEKEYLERVKNQNNNIEELTDTHKKMEEIRTSLNDDEKKEFKKLGLLNDDEN
tara:strand:+ start:430 stop:729 length:300 start_codon:yes stop_codon:yes gene_type:complete